MHFNHSMDASDDKNHTTQTNNKNKRRLNLNRLIIKVKKKKETTKYTFGKVKFMKLLQTFFFYWMENRSFIVCWKTNKLNKKLEIKINTYYDLDESRDVELKNRLLL